MKTKESRILFLCLILYLLETTTKAQNASSEATMETRSSIPGAGYDCLGVWKMISSALHEVKNGVFDVRLNFLLKHVEGLYLLLFMGRRLFFVILLQIILFYN